ncbi:MAG: hypothetical protein H0T92_12675 [Pyrinomonadaceae bacterium]|nr:hypothetical protein [Pyrinomonadaceae bacterium]
MDLQAFRRLFKSTPPPAGLSLALEALWYDARGKWNKAHELVQAQDDGIGAWVHAYLHRKEGDMSNAAYWYRRAGEPVAQAPLVTEWKEMVERLLH